MNLGLIFVKRLEQNINLPIIMVSALSSDHDRMTGYSAGADDYIAKPFNKQLLLARVNAVLRRVQQKFHPYNTDATQQLINLLVGHMQVTGEVFNPNGVLVALSQRELRLLQVLLANPHIALSREEITDAMEKNDETKRSAGHVGKALDVLIGRIRHKIEAEPKIQSYLNSEKCGI